MRRFVAVFLIILMFFSVFQGTLREETLKAETQPIWPMEGYNARHTGQCPYDTSKNNGNLKWKFKAGDKVWSSHAIGSDGTIYVGSRDRYLYALDPDGMLKWKFQTGGWIVSSPAIAGDGTIYVGSNDRYLYAINPDGTLKWKFETGDVIYSSPAIASDGTIYVGANINHIDIFNFLRSYLYTLNPDGTLKWKFKAGRRIQTSPAISPDGTIYVGSWDGYLYAIGTSTNLGASASTKIILQIGNPNIIINGASKSIDNQGSKPIIKNGRTLVQTRAFVEALGGSIDWNDTEKMVAITLKDTTLRLWINKPQAQVDAPVLILT